MNNASATTAPACWVEVEPGTPCERCGDEDAVDYYPSVTTTGIRTLHAVCADCGWRYRGWM